MKVRKKGRERKEDEKVRGEGNLGEVLEGDLLVKQNRAGVLWALLDTEAEGGVCCPPTRLSPEVCL